MYYGASTDRCPNCGDKYFDIGLYFYFFLALTVGIVLAGIMLF